MTLEEKIAAHCEICRKIQQLEEEKKTLAQEILAEMPSKKMTFRGHIARIQTRLIIGIPMDQARMLDATKMVEQIDKGKIAEIHKSGVALEGVREISYLIVTPERPSSLAYTETT